MAKSNFTEKHAVRLAEMYIKNGYFSVDSARNINKMLIRAVPWYNCIWLEWG